MGWEDYGTSRLTKPPRKITDTGIIGDAIRRQRADDRHLRRSVASARPEQFGRSITYPSGTFEFTEIEVQAASFTAPEGGYEWVVLVKNLGTIDTALVFAECGGGAASQTAPASRVFAIDDKSWTLTGGNVLTLAAQPASVEAEDGFTVAYSVTAKPLTVTEAS